MVAHCPLVRPDHFIKATRESGYRSTAYALAELIDNSIEASATTIRIRLVAVQREQSGPGRPAMPRVVEIVVADDGHGMPPQVLRSALQFAGSTRFESREGLGRFGMGLPNASVSHCTLTEVYSWVRGDRPHRAVLDCGAFERGELLEIPPASPAVIPAPYEDLADSPSGTIVAWKQLCRVDHDGKLDALEETLRFELGRLFRVFIAKGLRIEVNGVPVAPFDPLYLLPQSALPGDETATLVETLTLQLPIPGRPDETSPITIRFSLLPERWQRECGRGRVTERRRRRIDETRGVSVVRGGREIEIVTSLFRKQHWTDAWYRAEIRFDPVLDELFGITHTKQSVHIRPGQLLHQQLDAAMAPVIARLARTPVERVRREPSASPRATEGLAATALIAAVRRRSEASAAPATGSVLADPAGDEQAPSTIEAGSAHGAFFRHVAGEGAVQVALDASHPFRPAFQEVLRRDPRAASLIIDLLRTHRGGDVEGWSRRLAAVLAGRR